MPNSQAQVGANTRIRRLTAEDLERVVAIDLEITGRQRRGFFENRLAANLDDPRVFISLAFVDNGVVEGFALAHMLDGEFGGRHPVAVVDAIGTSLSSRRRGGARALIRELQTAARGRGAHELRTESEWTNNAMLHFLAGVGFKLDARIVLDRACAVEAKAAVDSEETDLSADRIAVRALQRSDLSAVVSIDRSVTNLDRAAYYDRKVNEALRKNGVRLSMLAEIDGTPAGFIMARVDYGEFGRTETTAVMDTLGVNPEFFGQGVGSVLMTQLLSQLKGLCVDRVRTQIVWNNPGLIAFLDRLGFWPTQEVTFTLALT
ncbi:MAG: GNAT family N-acetyltransferase [Alphaproteobacteria bacterium]|nr:GNAT family N-acetyltransferase [Alphaproteobacteria bacterium]